MVALACHLDLWPKRQPLQAPWMMFIQSPDWGPFAWFSSAFIMFAAPSGLVPGGSESGLQWSSGFGGGGEGPDCFSCQISRSFL
jgi:hypothetical protein